MDFYSILLISIALAMDAFSVSITKGFSVKNLKKSQILAIGLFFGGFQAFMPVLGWIAGEQIRDIVSTIAPIIAFILLLAIGIKMIYETIPSDNENNEDDGDNENSYFSYKELTLLGIATSIDAFAVGVSFSFLNTSILIPIIAIGLITFIMSEIGVYIGIKVGHIFGNKIEILGGVILILLGFKILLENINLF